MTTSHYATTPSLGTWVKLAAVVLMTNLVGAALAWQVIVRFSVQPTPAELKSHLESLTKVTRADLDVVRADVRSSGTTIKLLKAELSKMKNWQTNAFNPQMGWRRDVTMALRQIQATQRQAEEQRSQLEELIKTKTPVRCLGLGWSPQKAKEGQ